MKLLLVEDSERLQRSLSTGLKKHGFAVDQAFDGEQALSYTAVNQYDAIILDLMLPKIDGLTVLSKLRSEVKDCFDVAGNAHIKKPRGNRQHHDHTDDNRKIELVANRIHGQLLDQVSESATGCDQFGCARRS